MSHITKILIAVFSLFIIFIAPTLSMDVEEEEGALRQRLLKQDSDEEEIYDEEAAIPLPRTFEVEGTPEKRKRIDNQLRKYLFPAGGKPYFGTEYPPLESGVLVFNARYKPPEGSWDDPAFFVEEADKALFNQPKSIWTRGLQVVFCASGAMAPWGWGPLSMFLSQNIVWSSEIPEAVPAVIVYGTIAITTIPFMQQLIDRGGIVGNAIFDKNGLSYSKSDKRPHIRKLKKELELPFQVCGKPRYLPINIQGLCRFVAVVHGLIQTSPLIALFYDAEFYFPEYFAAFVGPLGVMLFEKGYSESLESLEYLAHRYFTNQLRMETQKKDILIRRLMDLKALINAKGSNKLVDELYNSFQQAMAAHKKNSSETKVFAASLFFLKRMENDAFNTLRDMIEEASRHLDERAQVTSLRNDEGEEAASRGSYRELEEMGEVVQTMRTIPIAAAMHLIEDISQLPGVTTMRRVFEYLAVRIPGIAETSRFLFPLWAIPKLFEDFGITNVSVNVLGAEMDPIFIGALSVSCVQLLIRAASEWYLQNDVALQLRRFGSTHTDFWPLRMISNAFSVLASGEATLYGPAIIFSLLTDSPTYVKVILSAAFFPAEMASFYRFFSMKYGNFIRSITTNLVRTTAQRRAVLNAEADKLLELIPKFDEDTTNEFYKLIQRGL